MNKKFAAIAIAVLMIIGMLPALATIPVVKAQPAIPPCATFDSHALPRATIIDPTTGLPALPPSTLLPWNGAPTAFDPFCVFLHPGAADTYKPGWSHTLDTLWNVQGPPAAQQRQIFDKYLDYAILASSSDSVGDLQFDFTLPPWVPSVNWIDIYVPPEFTWLAPTREESVWTDITNDYDYIWTTTRSAYDPIAPGWVRVRIGMHQWFGSLLTIDNTSTWHVRLFNLRAPEAAGIYHFKIYANGVSIGAGNYPFVVVKTELNPAYVMATVRTDLGLAPPFVSGKIVAEGTTPEGRAVQGVAWWSPPQFMENSPIQGEYGATYWALLLGLAAGTYQLTVTASGYDPTTTERITLSPGQSFATNVIVIFGSPRLAVTIYSKHGTGAIPWHNLWQMPYGTNNPAIAPDDNGPWRDILLDLYDSEGALVGFWASNVFGPNTALYHPNPAPFTGLAPKTIPRSNELMGFHDGGALQPTATTYHAVLEDNFDVLANLRLYPSTHWDGHVPWDTADYLAGMSAGQYTVEAFVTGYIMDEADAYQRQVVVTNVGTTIVFDLRRSNWIEVTMHVPISVPTLITDTSVTLTAEDAAGTERAAATFRATPDMITVSPAPPPPSDRVLDGFDASTSACRIFGGAPYGPTASCVVDAVGAWHGTYNGGIVLEGWNVLFPNVNALGGITRQDNTKDYGLNPTASTHSAGTVTLAGNPYTVKLYMSNMGQPWAGMPGVGWFWIVGGDPQVSVFLCNSPVSLSFKIQNTVIDLTLRSVDFEVPAHSRPWTFPGSEVWVEFVDSSGVIADTLDPTVYGLVQDAGTTLPGWPIIGALAPSFGVTPYDVDNQHPAGQHELLNVLYAGIDWTGSTIPFVNPGLNAAYPIHYSMTRAYRSTRLTPGEYTFDVYTHGYVQRRQFPFQIPATGAADIQADLIQGGQIRVIMDFKHENVHTNFNGYVIVEVLDAMGELRGASIYGQAEPNLYTTGAMGGGYLPYVNAIDNHAIVAAHAAPGPAQGAGFGYDPVLGFDGAGTAVPYGTINPAPPPWVVYPSSSRVQRAFTAATFAAANPALFTNAPDPAQLWAGWANMAPNDANRAIVPAGSAEAVDVYGFYWYCGDLARTWAGGWPTTIGWNTGGLDVEPHQPDAPHSGYIGTQWDYGLKGTVDIPGWEGSGGGLYTVKVWAFDPWGPNGVFDAAGFVDDWRMYDMAWDLTDVAVPWGGAVELFVTMNNLASLRGTVRWFDMYGNLRSLPWAQITASPGPATDSYPAYSSGLGAVGLGASDPAGSYIMWLPAGSHDVSVSTSEASQVWGSGAPTSNAAFSVVVSDGWVGGGDTQVSPSGVPVPELPSAVLPLGLFAVLAASVWLLRRKNFSTPILMK